MKLTIFLVPDCTTERLCEVLNRQFGPFKHLSASIAGWSCGKNKVEIQVDPYNHDMDYLLALAFDIGYTCAQMNSYQITE